MRPDNNSVLLFVLALLICVVESDTAKVSSRVFRTTFCNAVMLTHVIVNLNINELEIHGKFSSVNTLWCFHKLYCVWLSVVSRLNGLQCCIQLRNYMFSSNKLNLNPIARETLYMLIVSY